MRALAPSPLAAEAMPIGTVYAGVQLIFPNQMRGQVSALFMFILNFGGIGLGPLIPGVLNDHLFKNERMVGPSVSISIVFASLCMLLIFPLTYGHYRRDYIALNSAAEGA
jgi:MFS family permease